MKAYELRTQSKEDLLKTLTDLRKELAELSVAKVTGGAASKVAKIGSVRKDIARVLTVYNQQQIEAVRKSLKGAKYIPKDMRKKLTKAKRMALTKKQQNMVVTKVHKRRSNFPQRKYALKA